MTGLWVLVAVLAAASAVGALQRARGGRLRAAQPPGAGSGPAADRQRAALDAVGVRPGDAAVTLVQFSSAFCAPCRATRVVLGEVAAGLHGVRHVEIDAESHLDAVRTLGILRTPTTLVVDAAGTVVHRAAGQPRKEQVLAVVGELLSGAGGVREGAR